MDTKVGNILRPDDFESPFDEIVMDMMEEGRILYDSLKPHLQKIWEQRPLEILIVDNSGLNARAEFRADCDRISIFRGAIEKIYGNILGLLSVPSFFRTIGDVTKETPPDGLPGGRFPRVPMLKTPSRAEQRGPVYFPNDQRRMSFAQILIETALQFLVCHEIGHIMGGHLEILRSSNQLSSIAEFQYAFDKPADSVLRQVLECDADAFACRATSWVHIQEKIAEEMHNVMNTSKWQSKDFALLTYLTAVGVLFRVLYPDAPVTIDDYGSSHPHPAVRACLIASSVIGRSLNTGQYTPPSVDDILIESVGNIEDVWSTLCLPGQNPQPKNVWAKNVGDAAMALFQSYGNNRALLDQYARLPRRWDDWDWSQPRKFAE